MLLSGTGLLGVSLKHLLETPPGFRTANLLTGQLVLPQKNYKDGAARLAFIERLLPALNALPGVTHAAISSGLPFTDGASQNTITPEGFTPVPGESLRAHHLSAASGEYWQAMGIPLLEGRPLEDADNHRDQQVCVVDQAVAQRYWPGVSPLNRRLTIGARFDNADAYTVVGVVGNVKQNELAETGDFGALFFPYARNNSDAFSVIVRTELPFTTMAPMIRKAILQLDAALPIDDLKSMQARIDDTLITRRSPAILAAIFAGVALLLSAIGTYGVLAYAVAQRRREIGVRMALGALPGQIGRQFLSLGLRLLLVGTILGMFGAWIAGRAMQSLLFNVPPLHLATFVGTALIMGLVSSVACWLPTRRASHVDPMEALRHE